MTTQFCGFAAPRSATAPGKHSMSRFASLELNSISTQPAAREHPVQAAGCGLRHQSTLCRCR
jgi:hypothetical protein